MAFHDDLADRIVEVRLARIQSRSGEGKKAHRLLAVGGGVERLHVLTRQRFAREDALASIARVRSWRHHRPRNSHGRAGDPTASQPPRLFLLRHCSHDRRDVK